jgi:glycosyltransferase involved in cell wall biosynthesis
MKILILQETDWIKRNPIIQHYLAESLVKKGWEALVIDYEIDWRKQKRTGWIARRKVFPNFEKVYPGNGINIIRPGYIKFPILDYISMVWGHHKEINRQIADFKPDVIVGITIINAYMAMRAAKKNNIPFVYFYIDVNHQLIPFRILRPLGKYIEILLFKYSNEVITNSIKLKEYIAKYAPQRSINLIKSGIDLSRFNNTMNGKEIRKRYNIADNDLVCLFVGLLYSFSGLTEMITSLYNYPASRIKLLIVGDGDACDQIIKTCDKYGLNERVILAGNQPYGKIPEYIAASDICVMPFLNNHITKNIVPVKIYEYMAMAKPVISTRLPGVLAEFGNDNGIVFVNNPEQIVEKAIEIVRNQEAVRLGVKARSFAENCDWKKIAIQFDALLADTIKNYKTHATGARFV